MNIGLIIGLFLGITITTINNERLKKEYQEKLKKEKLTGKIEFKPAPKIEKVQKKKIKKEKE